VAEWSLLFQQVAQHKPPKWLSFDETPVAPVDTITEATSKDILSRTNVVNGGLLAVIPMLSFDKCSTSSEDVDLDMDLADVAVFIRRFQSHFSSLKSKWARAFTEVESGYGLLVKDLEKLHRLAQDQSQEIGTPVPLDGTSPPSVWQGLKVIHDSISTVVTAVQTHATSLDALAMDQNHLMQLVLALEAQADDPTLDVVDKVAALTVDLRAFENRVLRLVPLLSTLKRSHTSPSPSIGSDQGLLLASKLDACEQTVKTLCQVVEDMQDRPKEINVDASSIDSRLRELQTQMKQLQLVIRKGVKIANKTFQTFRDVKVWVDINLPSHWYGLFVDGVSIFEFFAADHVDAETTYSSFYSQHRTGFTSTFEARIASFVQNLFPLVFGKSDSNVDTTEALPALPTPEKWDSNDGNTGLRYQIMRNMAVVELQIQETITTDLGDYLEAQHIARECLHQSKRFALELCQFITLDFQKWKHCEHSKRDAWLMTAVCVRRIFEELYSERVVARDVYDQGNPSFTTGKYLWATWKAHSIMTKYLRHQFYDHPSISAV